MPTIFIQILYSKEMWLIIFLTIISIQIINVTQKSLMKPLNIYQNSKLTFLKQHKWKKLFIGLLILNITIILTLVVLLNIPAKETKITSEPTINDDLTSVLSVESNKDNLNELIKAYLNETLEESKYKYDVYLDE